MLHHMLRERTRHLEGRMASDNRGLMLGSRTLHCHWACNLRQCKNCFVKERQSEQPTWELTIPSICEAELGELNVSKTKPEDSF